MTKKQNIAANIHRYCQRQSVNESSLIPPTFFVVAGSSGHDLERFRQIAWREPQTNWIVKPANSNRGRGIEIMRSLHEVESHLLNTSPGTQIVIQRCASHSFFN